MPIKVKKQLTDQLTGLIQEQLLKVLAIRLASIFKLITKNFKSSLPRSLLRPPLYIESDKKISNI